MERLQIKISGNGLEARLQAGPGPEASIDDLRAALKAAGVTHGIDEAALQAMAILTADPSGSAAGVVARGTAAEAGTDGELGGDMLGGRGPGTVHADRSIDYRERWTLHPIFKGQTVATILPPTAGRPGRCVRGRVITPKAGRPHPQREGAGVTRQGNNLVATADGVVLSTDKLIDVVALYTHEGNVDYASGNLHSRGSLLVKGDVGTGFCVQADGDIAVTGAVIDASAVAGASIHIGQGVMGHSGSLRAEGDISCRHTTAARLVAGGRIDVADQSFQSTLIAGRIRITEGHGCAIAGELRARDSIDLNQAGSAAGPTTVLAVGSLLEEEAELARRTVAAARLERAANRPRRNDGRRNAKAARAQVRAGDEIRAAQLRLRQRQEEILGSARIRIGKVCHPGVVIRFGNFELRPDEPVYNAEFRFDTAQRAIVIGELP
ncbi:MAG: DUF342 domain-containing protein [Planctomycetes bacterium]|nr:DUF342 domain-containing protein [Planctomycetota bacterium]